MIEARRFGDEHQAESLADWCEATVYTGTAHGHTSPPWHTHTCITPMTLANREGKGHADIGDWIIRYPDGSVEIAAGGSQDGYCTDCGEPLWWKGDRLVTRSGLKWCQGRQYSHPGMDRWHALPGMAQYVVPAREGQVCHCLARDEAHIHQIVPVTDPCQAPLPARPAS
jgi:hypothetical protein